MKRLLTLLATLLVLAAISYEILLRIVPDQDPYIFNRGLTVPFPTHADTDVPQSVKLQCLAEGGIKVLATAQGVTELGFDTKDNDLRSYGCGGSCRRLIMDYGYQRIETNATRAGIRTLIGNLDSALPEEQLARLMVDEMGDYDYLASTISDPQCTSFNSYHGPSYFGSKSPEPSARCIASIYTPKHVKRTLTPARYRLRARFETIETIILKRLNIFDVIGNVWTENFVVNKRTFRKYLEEIYDAETDDILASKTAFPGCQITDAETGEQVPRYFTDEEIVHILVPGQ